MVGPDVPAADRRIKKFSLPKVFNAPEDLYLPNKILWRKKEQFSDGVRYVWRGAQDLQSDVCQRRQPLSAQHADNQGEDESFATRADPSRRAASVHDASCSTSFEADEKIAKKEEVFAGVVVRTKRGLQSNTQMSENLCFCWSSWTMRRS